MIKLQVTIIEMEDKFTENPARDVAAMLRHLASSLDQGGTGTFAFVGPKFTCVGMAVFEIDAAPKPTHEPEAAHKVN